MSRPSLFETHLRSDFGVHESLQSQSRAHIAATFLHEMSHATHIMGNSDNVLGDDTPECYRLFFLRDITDYRYIKRGCTVSI